MDLFLLVVVAAGVWGGWRRGFMASSADLATLVFSVAISLAVYQWPARWLVEHGLGLAQVGRDGHRQRAPILDDHNWCTGHRKPPVR